MNASDPAGWLRRAARAQPRHTALLWRGRVWNFRQLQAAARALAARLLPLSARPAVCALQVGNGWQAALALYATALMRRPLLPLHGAWRWSVCRDICRHATPSVLIRLGAAPPHPAAILGVEDLSQRPPVGELATLRLLVATSGTTARPKLVMLSDANVAAAVAAAKTVMPLAAGDLWLACVPLRHIAGLSILLRCLEAGAGVSIHDGFDAARVWRDLRGQPVTHLSLVPAMLHQLLQVAAGQPPPARLRCVLIGGAALDPSLAARAQAAGWPLCVSYGMSETASQIATECGALAGCEAGRVGVPLAGFALRLEGLGDARRIWLRGPALMLGYAAPGLAPGRGLADGWLLTGDIGRCDDGVLRLRGRADDMLISGGENLHPAEVEPVLRAAPGVDDAALAAVADPVWGDLLVAVFSGSATPDSVAAHCRRHLAGARRPRHFCQLERLPYTASGKLDRLALRDLAAAAVRVSVRR